MPPRSSQKKADLRACLICSILQTPAEFVERGCPNCEDVVEMQNHPDRVTECTSVQWDGMVAVMFPEQSWVARWQRIEKKDPGFYAVRVTGRPPVEVIENISAKGGQYRPRDTVDD